MQYMMGHKYPSLAYARGTVRLLGSSVVRFGAILALVIIVTLATTPVFAARQSIEKVDISNLEDSVRITISSTTKLTMNVSRLGKYYLVFDLQGYLVTGQSKTVSINSRGITNVKCGWFKTSPPTARIVVSSTQPCQYKVTSENRGCRTIISVAKPIPRAKPAASQSIRRTNSTQTTCDKPISTISVPKLEVEPLSVTSIQPMMASYENGVEPDALISKPILVASTKPVVVAEAPSPKPAAKRISLDFVASDIHDVLKALALQSGENVIAGPDVKGNITVSLNKVTVEEALKLVCNISGYQFLKTDSSYVVGTPETLKALAGNLDPGHVEQKTTEVALVQASDPAVVSKILQSQFSNIQVTMGADNAKGSNAKGPAMLIISGPVSEVKSAKATVDAVEKSYIESTEDLSVEIYEVKYAEISELPDLLMQSVPGLRVLAGPTQGFNMSCPSAVEISREGGAGYNKSPEQQKASPKTLILQGTQEVIGKAKALLAQLDTPQPQIVIEAKVMDITDNGAKDLGIDWGGEFGTLTTFSLTEDNSLTNHAWEVGRMDRSALSLPARLKGIIQSGKGKVLANPNVLALDGKPASIFIGDEIKYVTRVDASETGQIVVTTETARVGVQLHSISTINSDGYITMNLHPEVSVIVDWKELRDVSLALPQISRRFVDSTVRVKDGETIVIGGLIKDEEIKNMSGIPFLKDLPILGSLFRYDSKSKTHSEVMMFITPKIVQAHQ